MSRSAFLVWLLLTSPLWAGDLRVGQAAVDITPRAGMPMGGYFYVRLNTGVHDALYAKALVIEQDGEKAALVACDLVGIPGKFVDEARRLIEQKTGLRGDHVMISATHSHTGPEMDSFLLAQIEGPTAEIVKQYDAALPGKIAQAVVEAVRNLTPARAWVAVGREDSLCFNRRYVMKDGSIGWNPGKLNPNIVRPAGPTDPSVPVVYFDSPDSRPLATYVNYAMHLDTVGGTLFSADYPATLAKLLGAVKGPDMLTIFTIGTAGNVNHLDVNSPDPQQGFYEASRIGTILAGEVLKTYKRLKPVSPGSLRAWDEITQLAVQGLKPGEVEKARETIAWVRKPPGSAGPPFLDMVHAFKVLHVNEYHGKPINAEVQVITLGDNLAWVGLPGEIFVELGLAIKLASPYRTTIIAELAGDSLDYIPDLKAFAQDNYEPETARCQPGCGEQLVDTASRLLVHAYTSRKAD